MALNGDVILLSAYDGTAYRPIVCLTSNGLSKTAEVLSTQNKCAPGVVSKDYGSVDSSFSFDAEYMDDSTGGSNDGDASWNWLNDQMDAKTKFTARMTTGLTEAAKQEIFGTVLITDLELTGPAGDKSTFTGTLEVDGALSYTDPHP